jgi:hypothetical protein
LGECCGRSSKTFLILSRTCSLLDTND